LIQKALGHSFTGAETSIEEDVEGNSRVFDTFDDATDAVLRILT
jgi:hypothetical protein